MCTECVAVTDATIIQESVVIQHAPISQSFTCRYYRDLEAQRGWKIENPQSVCTNLTEQDMVFGGIPKLEQTIREVWARYHPKVIFVATSCATCVIGNDVGDDVESVVGSYRRRGVPIVHAETSGYRGNNFTGHETVIRAIIDQYADAHAGPREEGLVNVWSVLPYQNPFWRGDLEEIRRVLEGIGLRVNILFGHDSAGVEEWRAVPRAAFNLVLSPWLGLETARYLQEKYGQPFLHVPAIPIGAEATGAFLRRVHDFAGLDAKRTDAFIAAEERRYYLYLRDFSSFYAAQTSQYQLPSDLVVVGESAYNLAITAFMTEQLGLVPAWNVITENPPEDHRAAITAAFHALPDGAGANVRFIEDGYEIHQALRAADFTGRLPIVFGSTWDGELARQIKAPLVEIAYPATDEVVLSRGVVGYRGALSLIERVYTTVVRANTEA